MRGGSKMLDWKQCGKMVHHHCGYPLWVRAMEQFGSVGDEPVVAAEGTGDVVVEYRDPSVGDGLMVSVCPGCRGSLRLWWESGGKRVVSS